MKATRLIVTDLSGNALYDSDGASPGTYMLFPEILTAIEGYDVCTWEYRSGVVDARAAAPITYSDTIVGCVYMTEYDIVQGGMIHSMQVTVLRITLLLVAMVIVFTLFFSNTFSRRLNKVMTSMRIIQNGDYTHKVKCR